MTLTGKLYCSSAPAIQSNTYTSEPCRYADILALRLLNLSCGNGLFTLPHQTFSELEGSSTINLSLALLPVCGAVIAISDPCSLSSASPFEIACS